MTLTIFGATGRMQKLLIEQALAKGYYVTGYARDPGKMRMEHPHLKMLQGTLDDVAKINLAVKDADVVIETVGAISTGTGNIIDAMHKNSIKRLLVVSTTNVGDVKDEPDKKFSCFLAFTRVMLQVIGLFNKQVANAVKEVRLAAQYVRQSGLDWTLVRVTVLNDKALSNNIKSGYLGRGTINFSISRADMAAFILEQVTDRTYIGKAPAISN